MAVYRIGGGMMTTRERILFLSVLIILQAGCFSADTGTVKPRPLREFSNTDIRDQQPDYEAERLPFELWSAFRDLSGGPLRNPGLIGGDELLIRGRRKAALEEYSKLDKQILSEREQAAQILRIATIYLASDDAQRTLSLVSTYFKRQSRSEQDVNLEFAVLLAYGYGRLNDYQQSFAWFSKAHILANGRGAANAAADAGLQALLRTLPDKDLQEQSLAWKSDPYVSGLIGREFLRRQSQNLPPDPYNSAVPFWTLAAPNKLQLTPGIPGNVDKVTVGVALSLSDKFSAFGKSTKDGIQLAFEADKGEPQLHLQVRDIASDPAAAAAVMRDFATNSRPQIVIGPLLSESAVEAARVARELRLPMLSLSKSDSFPTGEGVMRLGVTTSSQIDPLIDAAAARFGARRFAVVYPQNPAGLDFVRALKEKLSSKGLSLVMETGYVGSTDSVLSEAASKIEGSNADAVLLPDNLEVSTRLLSIIKPEVRRRIHALGTASWDNPVKISNSQALFEGTLFVSPFFVVSNRPAVQQFVASYNGRYRSQPTFLAAQGFDAGTLVISAIRKSMAESIPFLEAMRKLPPYDGVTGTIRVGDNGEINRKLKVIEVLHEGLAELPDDIAAQGEAYVIHDGGSSNSDQLRR